MLIKHELHERFDCRNNLHVEYAANVPCVPERSLISVRISIKYIN
jgi:hypothetical protein